MPLGSSLATHTPTTNTLIRVVQLGSSSHPFLPFIPPRSPSLLAAPGVLRYRAHAASPSAIPRGLATTLTFELRPMSIPHVHQITMPVDVTKTRMQLGGAAGVQAYRGMLHCVTDTVRNEGVMALWKGLEPALWRQATYGGSLRSNMRARVCAIVGVDASIPTRRCARHCPHRPAVQRLGRRSQWPLPLAAFRAFALLLAMPRVPQRPSHAPRCVAITLGPRPPVRASTTPVRTRFHSSAGCSQAACGTGCTPRSKRSWRPECPSRLGYSI